jgi:hypothetical protein
VRCSRMAPVKNRNRVFLTFVPKLIS